MEPSYSSSGFLTKVKSKYRYGKEVYLTKWERKLYVHLNDNSKCWETGQFDKTKSKTISLTWDKAKELRERLFQLDE